MWSYWWPGCRARSRTIPWRDASCPPARARRRGGAAAAPAYRKRWLPEPWSELCEVRSQGHDAIVLIGIEREHARADAAQPHAKLQRGRGVELGVCVRRQDPGAAGKRSGEAASAPRVSLPPWDARQELGAGEGLARQIDNGALGAAGIGDQRAGVEQRSRWWRVSRMRPMSGRGRRGRRRARRRRAKRPDRWRPRRARPRWQRGN